MASCNNGSFWLRSSERREHAHEQVLNANNQLMYGLPCKPSRREARRANTAAGAAVDVRPKKTTLLCTLETARPSRPCEKHRKSPLNAPGSVHTSPDRFLSHSLAVGSVSARFIRGEEKRRAGRRRDNTRAVDFFIPLDTNSSETSDEHEGLIDSRTYI